MTKRVYLFGDKSAEGKADMKNLLGGKGANLAEMSLLDIPVPPGFTITTDVCTEYYTVGKEKLQELLRAEVENGLAHIAKITGTKFGDKENPCLMSVRSGARASMPGMMETVLNVGLNDETREALIKKTGNARFVYDSQRRLIQMYSDVVMEKAAGIEPKEGQGVRVQLEHLLHNLKESKGYKSDTDLTETDLKELIVAYKNKVKEVLGVAFPEDPMEQLWGAAFAVFQSWNGKRAIAYRKIEGIPHEWGTAVTVQTMVFGNMGDTSATGVAFTRNPATGENYFYGEWLVNAQGEDVVAGIRTPNPINEVGKSEHTKHLASLETAMPEAYQQLNAIQQRLEGHYHDMLDIEFTIQEKKLYMLQCRVGKRNGTAAVKMALDMLAAGMIDEKTAVLRVQPSQLEELLFPLLDPKAETKASVLCKGLPAGPGGAFGKIVLTAADAVEAVKKDPKAKVILVREETNPEDIEGMRAAQAILTARGGMTSHAALVARGWGKCCIVGAADIKIDWSNRTIKMKDVTLNDGDVISLNGTKGTVYQGELPTVSAAENENLVKFMTIVDKFKKMKVRTNADTPEDAAKARTFGAEGIGLFRTEHMFYGKNSEEPLFYLRKMIISSTEAERRAALNELFPYVKKDIKGTLAAMDGYPVTFRTLDPPLHEFVPEREDERIKLSKALNITMDQFLDRANKLHEVNPMMGHRGVRLGITYPEITEMQIRAIFESAAELLQEGKKVFPEIMIPVTCIETELQHQYKIFEKVYPEVLAKYNMKEIPHMIGTMIEIPRAALAAEKIAKYATFFSFGTNDLTQMTFGFSRDDIGGFLGDYLDQKILPVDPFQQIDQDTVGQLMKIACEGGRKARPDIKLGICGEHGGEPNSVEFCHKLGLSYVSCSPFRVPIARLAAAQAAIKHG
ncbi:MAG: pyruvate, phosphate dikinase [Bacteroidetes bacterium GWF2_38_335]|nr:MAG: pyruvate, phosphate dikinase [Bacteroidetes bacterium GWF2_38_335]HBS88238.1 pyruvate, phosphate dikinase [Bacteroidales bacterium]